MGYKCFLLTARTVLHDITDDAELIEVTTTALGAERLLKCDLEVALDPNCFNL